MKILIVSTSEPTLRSEVWGWACEDASLYVPDKPIGLTPGGFEYGESYATVLEALYYGWKLLSPPVFHREMKIKYYEWWLTKEDK